MASKTKKMDWNEDDEEEKGRKIIKTIESKNVKETPVTDNGKPALQKEIYVIRKTLLPVRRVVKQRKEWQKFGEVQGLPRGQHKLGDFARENEVTIQKSGEDQGGEIGIVAQLEGITTAGMRERQLERKKKDLENVTQPKETKPKGASKLDAAFGKNAGKPDMITLKISELYPSDEQNVEAEFRDFFDKIWLENNIRCTRSKFIFAQGSRRFLNRAFFTFADELQASKALAAVEGTVYNSVGLVCELIEDRRR